MAGPGDVNVRVSLNPDAYTKGIEQVSWATKQMMREQEAADRKWRALQAAHQAALDEQAARERKVAEEKDRLTRAHAAALKEDAAREQAAQAEKDRLTRAHAAALKEDAAREEAAARAAAEAVAAAERKKQEAYRATGQAMTAAGAAILAGIGASTKAAISWESAWAGVTKTVDATPAELASVEKGLRDLTRVLPASHEEIAAVAEAAGQLGVKAGAVTGFTKTMIDLGETTNLSADDAATAIAQMANVMDASMLQSGDGVQRFGSTLVALGNAGASTEADIMAMAARLSGAGKLVGASSADVLALASAMASMGIQAEAGGGVASRVLQAMYTAVADGGDKLEQFARVAGMSATEFATAFKDDPVRALAAVTGGLNTVEASGGNVMQTLKDLGFKSSEIQRVMLQLKGAGDLLTDSLDLANDAWADNTALIEEANKRYETTEAKVQIAKNSLRDAAIDIGATLLPVVAQAADGVAGMMRAFADLPGPVKTAVTILGGLVGVAASAGGGFLLLSPKIKAARENLTVLTQACPKAGNALRGLGKAAGIAGAALALLAVGDMVSNAFAGAAASVETTTSALLEGKDAIDELFASANGTTIFGGVDDLGDAIDRLVNPSVMNRLDDFAGEILSLGSQEGSDQRDAMVKQFNAIGESLGFLVTQGHAEKAAEQFDYLAAAWVAKGGKIEDLKALLPGYTDALAAASNEQELAGGTASAAADGIEQVDEAAEAAAEAMAEWEEAIEAWQERLMTAASQVGSSVDVWSTLWSAQEEAAKESAEKAKKTGDAWKEAFEPPSMDAWIEAMQAQAQAFAEFSANTQTAASQLKLELPKELQGEIQSFTAWLMEQGPEAMATFVNSSAEQREALVRAWAGTGDQLAGTLAAEVSDTVLSIAITADGAPALRTAAEVSQMVNGSEGTLTISANGAPVEVALYDATAQIDESTGTLTIAANDGSAQTTLSNFLIETDSATGVTTITGNDESGRRVTAQFVGDVMSKTGTVKIDADTEAAKGAVNAFLATLPTRKTINVDVLMNQQGAAAIYSASGGQRKALGGPITGGIPGKDSVPILAMPGEHMLTVKDVRALGGQAGVYAFRAALHGGVQRMASGGAVRPSGAALKGRSLDYWAGALRTNLQMAQLKQQIWELNRDLRAKEDDGRDKLRGYQRQIAQLQLSAAKRELEEAQYGDKLAGGHATGNLQRWIAEDKKAKDDEAKRKAAAEQAEADRQARRVAEHRTSDLRLERNRGTNVEQMTSGLSGARSFIDQMRATARDESLDAGARTTLSQAARAAEKDFERLYGTLTHVTDQLAAAKDEAAALQAISDQTANALGRFDLAGAVEATTSTTTTTNKWGETWSTTSTTGGGKAGILAAASAYATKVKSLASKIGKLVAKGFRPEIVSEVGAAGVEGGTVMADALLSMSAAEVKRLNGDYAAIAQYSQAAGQNVTTAYRPGGLWAADNAVNYLTGREGEVRSQITDLSKRLEDMLLGMYGIEARAGGGPILSGRPYLVGELGPELVVPQQSGYVLPADATRRLAAAGGSGVSAMRVDAVATMSRESMTEFARIVAPVVAEQIRIGAAEGLARHETAQASALPYL